MTAGVLSLPVAPEKATRLALLVLIALFVLKTAIAIRTPLVSDEAYYAQWAAHLSFGYYDHPPMIAVFIRAGQTLFGDTPFGVRAAGLAASVLTTVLVWRTGARLLSDPRAGAMTAVVFNATLFGHLGQTLATPDAPLTLFLALSLWLVARLLTSSSPLTWLGLGLAMGLGMLSKYAMTLPAAGLALVWLARPTLRRQLLTPWPWIAVALALLVFSPNLLWNAGHGWATWAKQGGRVVSHWTLEPLHLLTFLASQVGLMTPLLFILTLVGLGRAGIGEYRSRDGFWTLVGLMGAPMAYFSFHALRASVEGNWPGFLYPAASVAAVAGGLALARRGGWTRGLSLAAVPFGLVLIALVSALILFDVPSLGPKGPVARETAGWSDLALRLKARADGEGATFILTDNYQVNAQLSHALPGVTVLQYDERARYGFLPPPRLSGCGLAILRGDPPALGASGVQELAPVDRLYRGRSVKSYRIFRVCDPTLT